jgi:signal transduction histidine kinase
MIHRGTRMGVLAAFDRGPAGEAFTAEDEQLLRTFAASAGNAVALNRSVEADRLRATIAAADAERSRWARELHDQTLQSLGGLRVALASVAGRGDPGTKDGVIRQAIEDIELEIDNLRGIITDLRPSMLDDLGLLPAIEALVDRRREGGLEIETELTLPDRQARHAGVDPALETTIYRLVQESLTNVVKHANADKARVAIVCTDNNVTIEVEDDGRGFDTAQPSNGFGLAGMRERVYLAGGKLELESAGHGTLVRARLPRHAAPDAAAGSGADEMAS